jgi:hypothetical protein
MPGIFGIFSGLWTFSERNGRIPGTCGTFWKFSALCLRVLGRLVSIIGHRALIRAQEAEFGKKMGKEKA